MQQDHELSLQFENESRRAETFVARTWRGFSIQFSRLMLPSEYAFSWQGSTHYLAWHDLVLLDGEMVVNGGRPVPGGDLRDKMTFVPSGEALSGWAKPADRLNAFTVLSFEPSVIEDELEARMMQAELPEQIYFREDGLGMTMRKLGAIMADTAGKPSQAYLEAVALTATFELGHALGQRLDPIPGSGELGNRQRQMLLDYIDANLASDIGLEDMAAVCGLTRFHFSRAFKATFGEPPYRFLMRQRIERAKRLLAAGLMPVMEVAAATGFNGSTQFARVFREFEKMTPLEFRRRAV